MIEVTKMERQQLENFERQAEEIARLGQSLKWAAERLVDDVRTQLIKDNFEANIPQKLF
jgi:hypothetical protein